MISNTESYIDKSYIKPSSIATCIFCGALLSTGGTGILHWDQVKGVGEQYGYSFQSQPSQVQEKYQTPSPTWSSLDNIYSADFHGDTDTVFDASVSFDVVRKLAFMTVNDEMDKTIDDYFASKPVKTKIIFENRRIKKG